jgi:CRP-like cAMP-binding protein
MPASLSSPLIRKLEQLYPLTHEERSVLESACTRQLQFGADEDMVREGDKPSDCNLLLEGMSCRYKILSNGKRQIFSFHIPGDIFDAHSFILQKMDHSIATLTPCTVAVIPHKTMLHITETYPRIARAIWKDTLVDAALFREWMMSIGRRTAYQRIAHLMCELFVRMDAVGLAEGRRIGWPMTQDELGDALGLSNVHVNRTLQELRAANLIILTHSQLIIEDWEGLQQAGQFETEYLHLSSELSSETL